MPILYREQHYTFDCSVVDGDESWKGVTRPSEDTSTRVKFQNTVLFFFLRLQNPLPDYMNYEM